MVFPILFFFTAFLSPSVKSQNWDVSSMDLSKNMWMDSQVNSKITIFRPGGNYLVIAPLVVNPSQPYSLSVNILSSPDEFNHTLRVELKDGKEVIGQKFLKNIRRRVAQKIALDTLDKFTCQGIPKLRVQAFSSSGKKVFDVEKSLKCAQVIVSLIVQTEKNLYQPNDTVHYRIVAVSSDLTAYNGEISTKVIDSKQNVVAQLAKQTLKKGFCSGKIELGKEPNVGVWQIIVSLEKDEKVMNSGKKFYTEFTVYNKNEVPEVLTFDKYFSVNQQTNRNAVEIIPKKID